MEVPLISPIDLHTIIGSMVEKASITKQTALTNEMLKRTGKKANEILKKHEKEIKEAMVTSGTLPHSLKQLCSDTQTPEYHKVVRKMGIHTANLTPMQKLLREHRNYNEMEKITIRVTALIMHIMTQDKTLEEAIQETIRSQEQSKTSNRNFVESDLRKLVGEESNKKRNSAKGASFKDRMKIIENQNNQNSNTHMHKVKQNDAEAQEVEIGDILANTTAPNKIKKSRNRSKDIEKQKLRNRGLINHAKIEAKHSDSIVTSTGNRKFDCRTRKTEEELTKQVMEMLKEGETWIKAKKEAETINKHSKHKRSTSKKYPTGTSSKTIIYMCIPCTMLLEKKKTMMAQNRNYHIQQHKTLSANGQNFFCLDQEILTP